jgi:hypothetical protein
MPKTKSKMISIRVSEQDYELLKNEHASRGTRSVSAFTREALQRVIEAPPVEPANLQAELRLLDSRVATLQNEVSHLSRIVAESLLSRIKN